MFIVGQRSVIVGQRSVISRVSRLCVRHYGYETCPFMNAELQNSLLEKSIRTGCNAVYTRSTTLTHQIASTYELLSDLSATEEVNLSQFTLGHYCSVPNVETALGELEQIRIAMGKRRYLDFITVSVDKDFDEKMLTEIMTNFGGESVSFGFHFSSTVLQKSADVDIDKLLFKLSNVLESCKISSPTFAVATNCLTFKNASKVAEWARMQDKWCRVIASEILRIHDRRPSLLGLPIKKASPTGIPTRDAKALMLDAMENLKASFDRCIHMELQYIERLSMSEGSSHKAQVNIHDLCVGHALLQSQPSILSAEEWHYLLHSQVEPRWLEAMNNVRSASKESAEWASLYSGLAKHLFATFSDMQDARKFLLMDDVLKGALGEGAKGLTVEDIGRKGLCVPIALACTSKDFINADIAMLSGVEVIPEEEAANVAPELLQRSNCADSETLFRDIKLSCSAYV